MAYLRRRCTHDHVRNDASLFAGAQLRFAVWSSSCRRTVASTRGSVHTPKLSPYGSDSLPSPGTSLRIYPGPVYSENRAGPSLFEETSSEAAFSVLLNVLLATADLGDDRPSSDILELAGLPPGRWGGTGLWPEAIRPFLTESRRLTLFENVVCTGPQQHLWLRRLAPATMWRFCCHVRSPYNPSGVVRIKREWTLAILTSSLVKGRTSA